MKKKIMLVTILMTMALMATGCGSGDNSTSQKKSTAKVSKSMSADTDSVKKGINKVTGTAVKTEADKTEPPAVTDTSVAENAQPETTDTNTESANTEQPAQSAPATQSDNKPADNSNTKQPASNNNAKEANADPTKQPSVQAQNNTPAQPAKTPAPAATAAPHQHSYTATITTNATCNNAGVKTYTCSCGSSYTESIPATGAHNWVNHTVTRTVAKSVDLSNELHTLSYHNGCDVEVTKLRYCACGKYFLGDAAMLHEAIAYNEDPTSRHNQRSCDPSIDNPSGYYYIEGTLSTATEVDYVYCSVCGTHK